MSGNFTLFKQSATGAGSDANSYLQDAFDDITLPANSNGSFTSSASTNPISQYFSNDDLAKFQTKTLWVKDLVLIQDHNKWVSNKPTYQIVWSETFPGVFGYVSGNVKLRNYNQGLEVEVKNIGDICGVTGVIRKVAWIVNAVNATGTATLVTDGVDGSTITFGGAASAIESLGVNKYNLQIHSASNATYNIHDYRLKAVQYNTLKLAGVVVYYENASANIDQFPGVSYVNKNKKTTISGTSLSLPSIATSNGGRSKIYKTASNTFALSTQAAPSVASAATGSSGTNLVNLTTGHGSSFPIGSCIVATAGSSQYFGQVLNQSTDTLTMGQTLPFALSAASCYKSHVIGSTQAINASLMTLAYVFEPEQSQVIGQSRGFFSAGSGDFFWSHPEMKYRFWGQNLSIANVDGYNGVGFASGGSGFFQVDGRFSAAEVELAGSGIFHATFGINGIPGWGDNAGFTGVIKKTVFTDGGPGWNSFVMSPGSSFGSCVVTKVYLYENAGPIGVSFGTNSIVDTHANTVLRTSDASNATLMPLGAWRRTFADHLYYTGEWSRGLSAGHAGGVAYSAGTADLAVKFQYFGSDFAVIGTAGSSGVLTIDGASTTVSFNSRIAVGSTGFHSVVYTHKNGTSFVSAIDHLKPITDEVRSVQKFKAVDMSGVPSVFNQTQTPQNPKDLDIWAKDGPQKTVWIYLFGTWNQIQIGNQLDDPNIFMMIRSHGVSAGNGTYFADAEQYNFVSWASTTSDTTAFAGNVLGEAVVGTNKFNVDGLTSGPTLTAALRIFNKTSWSTGTTRSSPKQSSGVVNLIGTLVVGGGSTNTSYTGASNNLEGYNGSSWSTYTSLASSLGVRGAFFQNFIAHFCLGTNSAASGDADHDTWNGSSRTSSTAVPAAGFSNSGSRSGSNGVILGSGSSSGSYTWNGSSWGSKISFVADLYNDLATYNVGAVAANNTIDGNVYTNGGALATQPSACMNNTYKFNSSAWSTGTASNTSRGGGSGGIF
jgi:hypothetical protein